MPPKKSKIGGRNIEQDIKEEKGSNLEVIQRRIDRSHENTIELWLNNKRIYQILREFDISDNENLNKLKEETKNPDYWKR